jgi:outer membrane cobalamin receptor
MGGVINIVTPPATRRQLDVRAQYGTHNTPKLDTTFADLWGRLGVVATVSALNTDGFPIVAEAERGRVDNDAAVEYGNGSVKLDYQASESGPDVRPRRVLPRKPRQRQGQHDRRDRGSQPYSLDRRSAVASG